MTILRLPVPEPAMRNADCTEFLKWSLPRLGLAWPGFRKVRGTVCKRVARRLSALGLADLAAYRAWLETHPEEWAALDVLCRIPISRFWRDPEVFGCLARDVLPALAAAAAARGDAVARAWSAGCASGEEPYSLRLAWTLHAAPAFPSLRLDILATDADATLLARARDGRYRPSSLRELPPELVGRAFDRQGDLFELRPEFRHGIAFHEQDIRASLPDGPFDLVLCRNLAFTYFDDAARRRLLAGILPRLRPGAALVIGAREFLPEPHPGLVPWNGLAPVYRFAPPQ
jgi:chemotaxis protein methyltransferase CheR